MESETTIHKKVAYAFNKFYLNFLNDLKSYDDDFKKHVKSKFKVFDKTSVSHIQTFREELSKADDDIEMVPGLTLQTILDNIEDSENTAIVKSYLYIFKILGSLYDDTDDLVLEKILDIIRKIKEGADVSAEIDEVVDDDLRTNLALLQISLSTDDNKANIDDTMKMFENSMIGSIAKEISEEINVNDLNIKDPSDLLNMKNLGSEHGNVLGNIVSKVSTKIQSKITEGKINQSDLISEAMGMIGMLNSSMGAGGLNNPMFAEVLKSFGNMPTAQGNDTRTRLKKKLEDRQKMSASQETAE